MPKLLILLLSLLLTACSSAPVTSVQSSPLPPVSMLPTSKEPAVRYTVEMETWEDASQTEGGTPLVSYSYTLPVLQAERADGTKVETPETEAEEQALAVAAAFNIQFDTWAAAEDFEELTQEAQADLEWRRGEEMEWTQGYVLELDCEVYQTEDLISVSGTYYSYIDGTAHPNMLQMSWNFDLDNGEFFAPDFLAEDTQMQTAVTEEIIRQANSPLADGTIPAEGYWEDYPSIAANWNTTAVTFNQDGMVISFSPYELAAYGLGTQTFRVSYEFLRPYLSDHGLKLLGLTEG